MRSLKQVTKGMIGLPSALSMTVCQTLQISDTTSTLTCARSILVAMMATMEYVTFVAEQAAALDFD